MGTQSSDFRILKRNLYRNAPPAPAPVDPLQRSDANEDFSDGGGKGFMLFLLAMALSTLAWLLI